MDTLEDALRGFDGKATATLARIRTAFGDRPDFLSDLVWLTAHDEAPISDGATWLIKDLLDHGARLGPTQTDRLVGRLPSVSSWQAQLHLCQSIRHLETSALQAAMCADWLGPLLESDRPFLRAWSMDALQHLAGRNGQLARRAEAALKAAEQDPAVSVRARARNWRKPATRR